MAPLQRPAVLLHLSGLRLYPDPIAQFGRSFAAFCCALVQEPLKSDPERGKAPWHERVILATLREQTRASKPRPIPMRERSGLRALGASQHRSGHYRAAVCTGSTIGIGKRSARAATISMAAR